MSKLTLVIPDVHEQIERLKKIEEEWFPKVQRVVMLGDFFDTFLQKHSREIAEWIKAHPDVEKLLGNHDCSYFFSHTAMRCSGYDWKTQTQVDAVLHSEHRAEFKLSTNVGKFLLSHAGYHPVILHEIAGETVDFEKLRAIEGEALWKANNGGYHWLFAAGRARGGDAPVGGVVWLDFNYEFKPCEIPQVVGHTRGKKVKTAVHEESGETSYCIDTSLNHLMIIDEETNDIEIVTLDGKGAD